MSNAQLIVLVYVLFRCTRLIIATIQRDSSVSSVVYDLQKSEETANTMIRDIREGWKHGHKG